MESGHDIPEVLGREGEDVNQPGHQLPYGREVLLWLQFGLRLLLSRGQGLRRWCFECFTGDDFESAANHFCKPELSNIIPTYLGENMIITFLYFQKIP